MGPKTSVSSYMLTDLKISSLTRQQFYDLPKIYTQKRMPVTTRNLINEEELAKWPHLDGVTLPRIQADVELLIGTNASKLLEPWEVVNSRGNGPSSEDKEEMSRDDMKFMKVMTDSCKLEDGHYTLELPFKKKDAVSLPNNHWEHSGADCMEDKQFSTVSCRVWSGLAAVTMCHSRTGHSIICTRQTGQHSRPQYQPKDVCEEHLLSEQHKWSFRMDKEEPQPFHIKEEEEAPHTLQMQREENNPLTSHFKEEEEEHSISQEWLEEFHVIVKSEDDEVKGESEEKREAEPPSSSSTQHMTTEADGDHCGGSQADKLLAPLSDSEDTTSHSPDTDDEHSKDDKTCHTDNKRFTCSHCDKTFKSPSNLKIHMRTHTGEKPFSCSICGKDFNQKGHLERHIRTHTGEKPFSCSICGKDFNERSNLKIHIRTHTGEKPFFCSECGKRFKQGAQLKIHMRTHTLEKPFSCSICGKDFTLSRQLKSHMTTHAGEKPFTCSECGKRFARKYDLKPHMRKHTGEKPFSCSKCGKSFVLSRSLKVHMRIHTGEKPFLCSVCGKSFIDHKPLKLHMRTHSGEKPYSCSSCNKSFSCRKYYILHMRTHTGEKVWSCSVCGERFSYEKQCKKHKCAGENSSSK
ncbi:zinc finger protein 260-like [Entelurus aequoreus]|uniref:zinc finger protein 260-like n=1 Tax=Entelurus aequoreus TaxID=161455 RepID=UPI002B1D8669|nr:zinc finger protein 260-like [Entelurus aequoreus]